MDILTFLTQTLEGKAISVTGLSVVIFIGCIWIINRYFDSQRDERTLTKTLLANQTSMIATISEMTTVNQATGMAINENAKATAGLAGLVERTNASIDRTHEISSSIRDQLSLDRTLVEAKLTDMPAQVAQAVQEWFGGRFNDSNKALLTEFQNLIRTEGARFRVGAMTIGGNGDILNATTDFLDMTGTDKSIVGKNVIKDDVLRVIAEDGTPLIAEQSPFYYALSKQTTLNNAIVGIFNPRYKDFSWFMLKVAPTFSGTDSSKYAVTLTAVSAMAKVPTYNAPHLFV